MEQSLDLEAISIQISELLEKSNIAYLPGSE